MRRPAYAGSMRPSAIPSLSMLPGNTTPGASRGLAVGLGGTVPPAITLQREPELLLVVREPVGAGADGVIGEVLAALAAVVVGDRLPRDWGGEGHGEPVEDLRVGLGKDDVE